MSKTVNVKYFAETVFAKEPQKATEESAGYDLYVAEAKTIMLAKMIWFVWTFVGPFQKIFVVESSLVLPSLKRTM